MHTIKKSLCLVLVALLLVGMLAGCSNAPADSAQADTSAADQTTDGSETTADEDADQITITFTSWVFVEESVKATYQYMVDKYMELHPNVTIEVKSWPWAQCKDQMVMSIASGDTPDISHIECEWLPALYDLDALYDLNDLLSDDLLNDFYPSLLSNSTFDDQLVGVPFFTSPTAMWYNKTLLAEAGITELPTTWAEMMADAEKIAALGSDADGNRSTVIACPMRRPPAETAGTSLRTCGIMARASATKTTTSPFSARDRSKPSRKPVTCIRTKSRPMASI
jgi:multiple sugar transport system substrate-binding protein